MKAIARSLCPPLLWNLASHARKLTKKVEPKRELISEKMRRWQNHLRAMAEINRTLFAPSLVAMSKAESPMFAPTSIIRSFLGSSTRRNCKNCGRSVS